MPKRIRISRENAGEDMTLEAPLPATVVYGEYVHCPTCGKKLKNLNPNDPWEWCNFCGKIADLTKLMAERGYLVPA